MLQNGVGHRDMTVVVLDDDIPELTEAFTLQLVDLYNEAVIQPSAVSTSICIYVYDTGIMYLYVCYSN